MQRSRRTHPRHTHTHTRTGVCVCVCVRSRLWTQVSARSISRKDVSASVSQYSACVCVRACVRKLGDRLQMLPKKQDQVLDSPLLLKVMTDGSQHGPNGLESVCSVFQYIHSSSSARHTDLVPCVRNVSARQSTRTCFNVFLFLLGGGGAHTCASSLIATFNFSSWRLMTHSIHLP